MTEAAPTLPSTASQEWCKVFAELPDVQEKVNWLQSRITKTWRENHPESPLKGPTQDEIGRCWQSIFESIFEPTTPKQHTPEFPPPARQTTRESIETFLNNEEPWNTFFPRKDKTPSTSPLSPEQGSQGSFGPILDFPLNNSAFLQFHGMQMNEDVHTVNRIHNGVNDSFEHLGTAVVIDPSKNIYAEATQPDAPYAFPSEHGLLDLLGSSIGTPSLTTTSVTDFAFPGATTPACQQSGYQQGGNSYEPGGNPVYMAGEGIYPSSAVNQEIFDQQLFPGNDTAAFQKQLTALDSVFTPLHQPSLTCYEEVVRFDHEVRPNETKTEERPRLEIKPFESVAMNRTTIRPPVHDTGLNQIPSPYVQPLDRPPTSQDNLTDSQQVGQSNGNRINDECCGITFTYAWKLMYVPSCLLPEMSLLTPSQGPSQEARPGKRILLRNLCSPNHV